MIWLSRIGLKLVDLGGTTLFIYIYKWLGQASIYS